MKKRFSFLIKPLHLVGDLLLINLAFFGGYYFEIESAFPLGSNIAKFLLLLFNLGWLFIAFYFKIYEIPRVIKYGRVALDILKVTLIHAAINLFFVALLRVHIQESQYYFYVYIALFILVVSWRFSFLFVLQQYRKIGFNYRSILIVGKDPVAKELLEYLQSRPIFGYRFEGFVHHDKSDPNVVCDIEDLEYYLKKNEIDEIYCSSASLTQKEINRLSNIADFNLVRIKLVPDYSQFSYDKVLVRNYGHLPIITFRNEPLNNYMNAILKRTFDIAFSLTVLTLIFSWIYPLVSLLIKITGKGPVFFMQKRTGRFNETFWCYKFRTMEINENADLVQAVKHDPRITWIGKILRKTNLDELPQFINVLLGDMSVVGPRPHMLRHTEQYCKIIDRYMARHFVKPGITGLAQVKGFRGQTTKPSEMKNRVRMDIFYIENWTFIFDITIIFRTIIKMVKGDSKAY